MTTKEHNDWIRWTWIEIERQVFIDEPAPSDEPGKVELDELMQVKIKKALDELLLPEGDR